MAEEEFRLLASALRLGRFTPAEIGRDAGANPNTVRSWLRRNLRYVEQDQAAVAAATGLPGRPRKTWRLREAAVPDVRRVLDGLYPLHARPAAFDLRAAGYLANLDRVEGQLAAWRTAQRTGDERAAEQERAAAQSWLRITWQDFAELEQGGHAISQEQVLLLAELERDLGLGQPPEHLALQAVATWLAQRIERMIEQGAPAAFAARVVRARMEVRETHWQERLTAAAQAARVWADEGLAESAAVGIEAMQLCLLVAEVVPLRRRLAELGRALLDGPGRGMCDLPEHSQAVLVSVARQQLDTQDQDQNDEVSHWLWVLHGSRAWRDEMAPPFVLGMSRASWLHGRNLADRIVKSLREALRVADGWSWQPGALRREALAYGDQFVRTNPNPAGWRIGRSQLDLVGSIFARRPWSAADTLPEGGQ